MKIPEKYQQLCKDIANVLKEFEEQCYHESCKDKSKYDGVISFQAEFQPKGMGSDWGKVEMRWNSGRHHADVNQLTISSQLTVRTVIKATDS